MVPNDSETSSVRRSRPSSEKDPVDVTGALRDPEKDLTQLPGAELTDQLDSITYVSGFQYWAIVFVIGLTYFLTTVDTTIATTSLVAITDDLGGFQLASWILTSYLLGYVAVIVILAKFSDIFGRKLITIGCIFTFTVSSAGCAASQTLTQLIILRAFQGVGGGGSFALASILLIESVPPEKYADAVARNGISVVLGYVLGPIIGGGISERTTWRWIFIINIPIGVIILVLALIGIPNGFPYQGRPEHLRPTHSKQKVVWAKIDVPGTLLIFLATLSITACLQEAESRFPWNSVYVIVLLVLSAVFWIVLMLWERHVTLASRTREPVLPWRFFTHRATLGLLLSFIVVGAPIAVISFQLPQRFQLLNGLSNFDAGVRIIPFGAAFAFGAILSAKLANGLKVPGIYVILVGDLLQIAGFALLGTSSATVPIQPGIYGYQVMAGLGCSFGYTNLIMLVAYTAEKRDGGEFAKRIPWFGARASEAKSTSFVQIYANISQATALGAANQFRAMGAAVGLAVVTSVFNSYIHSQFERLNIASGAETAALMSLVSGGASLSSTSQDDVRQIVSDAYNRQMLILAAFGAVQIPLALMMWRRKQVVVA